MFSSPFSVAIISPGEEGANFSAFHTFVRFVLGLVLSVPLPLGVWDELRLVKSALNPPVVCSTDRSKAVVPVLVLLFVALGFILRGDLLYVFPCVILFLCFLSF